MGNRPGADTGEDTGTEPDDLGQTYDRLAPSLYRYALMILTDAAAAEDVVHDVFARLARRGTGGLDSSEAYLRRSIRNECFSLLRGRRRRPVIDRESTALLEAVPAQEDHPAERMAIERALKELPADQREVVHLKVFEGLTFQEIAQVTDESINTVASRYRYGIEKLRIALGENGARHA